MCLTICIVEENMSSSIPAWIFLWAFQICQYILTVNIYAGYTKNNPVAYQSEGTESLSEVWAALFVLVSVFVITASSFRSWRRIISFQKYYSAVILFIEMEAVMSWEELGGVWPVLLGGRACWTVGLVVTIIAMCTIIAADTGAFIGGRVRLQTTSQCMRNLNFQILYISMSAHNAT